MSLGKILGTIFIGPLKVVFEVIFSLAYSMLKNPGLAVIVLSLAMNILVLPLYRRADAIQIQARDTENKLRDVIKHIKKTFTGDERMMILQTYYRQNNYSPLSVLSGSISLLLEIPFFMAAYQFLSNVDAFSGTAFGPIRDLSLPDGLLNIGGFTVNVLPIVMTLINVVSSALYLKGFPLKTKIQLYGMALFFLVFLYNSPSALVFYWTLNNTFSLLKTLYYRIKNSRKVLNVLLGICGVGLMIAAFRFNGYWKRTLLILLGLAAQFPWALPLIRKKLPAKQTTATPNTALFLLGGLFLTALVGLLIPSTYIGASVQEYIDLYYFYNPVWYIINALCLAAGTFLVWFGVFYWLASPKVRVVFTRLVWVLCGVMLVNYMFFGRNLGVMSSNFWFETGVVFARKEHLLNIAVVLVLGAGLYFAAVKFHKKLSFILLIGVIALVGMGTVNTAKIGGEARQTKEMIGQSSDSLPQFDLSQSGQNVVVIMLDRGIGPFVPYLMEENPQLQKQFDGFTYYSNTLSYGAYTNFGAPSLYGGYDYTPVQMNLRDTESLGDKHNEALLVAPTVFSQAGYDVTVIDPSYAGYQWIPDTTLYEGMQGVTAYRADGRFNDMASRIHQVEKRSRNVFYFCLMKTLPVSCQNAIYQDGEYHALPENVKEDVTNNVSPSFMNAYRAMENLSQMTQVVRESENTYMFIRSNVTHEQTLLQEPYFIPQNVVDNSAYYPAEGKTITAGDQSYLLDTEYKISHYHINMAAFRQLGQWFDYLRDQDVYDNTRIIIVSDHGRGLQIFDQTEDPMYSTEYYAPMLLVKDFDAEGFTVSEEFMTNADVPALSMEGIIEDPVNPFTGNPIDTAGKKGKQYVILSEQWDITVNNANQFIDSRWASVYEDIWNKENWEIYEEESCLPPGMGNS